MSDVQVKAIKRQVVFTRKKVKDRDNFMGYLFVAPWIIGFFSFTMVPMIASLYLSFTDFNLVSPPVWVGVQNYINMFTADRLFWESVIATFHFAFVSVPLRLVVALFLAILIYHPRPMVGVYRAILYIPSMIGGSVAVAVMWRQMFGSAGAINSILMALNLLDRPVGWIGHPDTAIWTLILLAAWQFGSPMLIFLAGLKQIPASLHEAADIDGANWWQRFVKITIPMLSPVILFNFIMQTIAGFMAFTQAFVITGGGPMNRTLFYMLYLYRRAFEFFGMGYASALAWVILIVIGVMTLLIFKSSDYWVYYESKGRW